MWMLLHLLTERRSCSPSPSQSISYQQDNHFLPFHSLLRKYRIDKNKLYSHFEEICLATASQISNKASLFGTVVLSLQVVSETLCKLFLIASILVWGLASCVTPDSFG